MTDHGNYVVEGEEAVALDLGVHVLAHRTAGQQPNLEANYKISYDFLVNA